MIYYVLLYPINRYFRNHLIWVYVTAALVVIVRYLTMERPDTYDMSGNIGYFKWLFFFLIMLMGAMMGISQKKWNFNLKWDTVKLLLSIVAFYAIYAPCKKIPVINDYQLFALIPLHFVVLYFYKVCNSDLLKRIYEHRIIGWCIKAVGGLCLEIYLIQNYLFTDKMNHLFPLNIFIMFFLIFISAYGLRCVSCIFAQTFKDGEYDWKAVVKIV